MKISEQLDDALVARPPNGNGLIVKLLKLNNSDTPAQEAQGPLPLVVVGHRDMTSLAWAAWVRNLGVAHYGSAFTEKMIRNGIDLKEMGPTAAFGRSMRQVRSEDAWRRPWEFQQTDVDRAIASLTMVEKWPSLYNQIAIEMAEEEMALDEFIGRIHMLPTPLEVGEGRYYTLGDVIGRNVVRTPSF